MQTGTRIGHYEVVSAIGRGGMGEVWKARDTKLRRDVALKTLPPEFISEPDRLARLEREAMLLASLSHPNIAAIHGLEQEQGAHVLVLELVEGNTLAERLLRGPIPVEQTLEIAVEISEALEAAHEKGVVHRDLKPANIKLTPDGRVKVLDFGLATTLAPGGADSRTQTALRTQLGAVMGTPAYMSPEQARGESAGRQSDIWAFGVVLFEMLTGASPFARDTAAETLANVLGPPPDYSALPATTPGSIQRLLKRCLDKDPKRRFQHSGDLRFEVEEALALLTAGSPAEKPALAARRPRLLLLAAAAAALSAVAIVASFIAWTFAARDSKGTNEETVRLSIASLPIRALSVTGSQHVALSPDGTRLAYAANGMLLIRRLRDQQPVMVAVEAISPFFSPDGASVGYAYDGIWRVPSTGGTPVRIALSTERAAGAAWGSDGTIVFATTSGLYRIAASGGEPQLLARPDPQRRERLYAWPDLLPDNRGLLFTIVSQDEKTAAQIAWLDIASLETKVVATGGTAARYVPTGHLVYVVESKLMAVAFDLDARVTRGEPVAIRDVEIATALDNGAAEFTVAANGTLAFISPATLERYPLRTLVWVDRDGNEEPLALGPGRYIYPRVSPDGTRIAVDVASPTNRDIWIWDLRRASLARLTDGPSEDMTPHWSHDGRRIFFASDRTGNIDIYSQPADGSTQARVELATPRADIPNAPLPDGHRMMVTQDFRDANLLDLDRGEVEPLLQREADDWGSEVSPDGRWLAYESNEAGPQFEIFLRPFPDIDARREKVSIDGGRYPHWGPEGSGELYYVDLMGGMMSATVETSPELSVGAPKKLFDTDKPPPTISGRPYDVNPVDGRFIVTRNVNTPGAGTTNVDVVLNWFKELEEQVPTP
jgi:eukaryotic-like serine/threonine-protein kinase